MSEMKIPQEPHSVPDRLVSASKPEDHLTTSSSAPVKDSIQAYSTNELSLSSTKTESSAPQLETPEIPEMSLVEYFKAISGASLAFRRQLSASDLVDQSSRSQSSQAAAVQAEELAKLYETRKQALAQLEGDARKALEESQKKLDEMQKGTKEQQDRIDKINSGNAEEKQKFDELNKAYADYIKNLDTIGVVYKDGKYLIPEGAEEQFKALTEGYQKAVDQFNGYWKERQNQINEYNSATDAYNKAVGENNAFIKDLINKYNLSSLQIPNQKAAGLRDLTGYPNRIEAPTPPYNIEIKPPPKSGPLSPSQLGPYTPIDKQILYDGIYNHLYEIQIAPIDQKIQTTYTYWAFLNMQRLYYHNPDTVPDPLLNTKMLALKILPDAYIQPAKPVKTSALAGGAMALQAIGLGNSNLEEILGRDLLKEALKNLDLKSFDGKDAKFKEQKINNLVDQLLLLSVGLLANQSLQALFPSLGVISQSLDTLPKDSPAFAILFAVSLANRIQEEATQGITAETLQKFLNGNSDLATLTDEDKAKLSAVLNLGQLLVAGKMLESTLGLQGLMAQILPALSPSLDPTTLLSQASQEGRQSLVELQTHLESHFVDQGYLHDEAQFLAQVGSQLTEQGLLTPSATSLNSPHSFNQPLLVDSVKASLVLAGHSLTKANALADEAIAHTLAEGPYHSPKQFRTALDVQLQDLGIGDKSSEIANQAILIPPAEKSLDFLAIPTVPAAAIAGAAHPSAAPTPATPIPGAPATQPTKQPLSPVELMTILEKRSLQLLTPQLGAQVAKQVTEEIAKTLFGNAHPDSRDIADVKSPYSLINVMKDQLQQLNVEQNHEWAATVSQVFKETIKTMVDFYAFSLKIMDPAYLFVYSGIIHGDRGKKKPDILI